MFRKLSGTRAAGFKCTGSGGKCSELVQMENAISRLAKSELILSPKSQEPIKRDGLMQKLNVVFFHFSRNNLKFLSFFSGFPIPTSCKIINYSRVFIRYKDSHYLGLLNTYTQLCNFYLFLAKLLKTYHLVRLFILC